MIVGFFRAFDIQLLDYPYQAAIQQALELCDQIIIAVSRFNRDDTYNAIEREALKYANRIITFDHNFILTRGWQEEWWDACMAHEPVNTTWRVWLDLDELILDPQPIRTAMSWPQGPQLIRFPFVHLYGTPNYQENGVFLTHNTRAGHKYVGYRMKNWPHGAACAAVYGNNLDAHLADGPIILDVETPILHYGWARSHKALQMSQSRHRAWYDLPPNDLSPLTSDRVIPYQGTHPDCMEGWFYQHQEEWHGLEVLWRQHDT